MKKLLILSALFGSLAVHADNEKNIKTKVQKAIVYQQGAQLSRSAEIALPAGQFQLVFEGLESSIDPKSIQVGGKGNFIITEVLYTTYYPELTESKFQGDVKYQKLLKILKDSIRTINYEIKDLNGNKEILTTEKTVLLNYKLYKGDTKKDSLAYLKEGLSFLREKLMNIYKEIAKIERKEFELNESVTRINNKINEIYNELGKADSNTEESKVDYRVIVSVINEAAIQANLTISYYVPNAGWSPIYDLRTESIESKMKLTYKAMVQQGTGVDWKDVRLVLSTGNPNQSFVIPQLNTWYLDGGISQFDKKKRNNTNYNYQYGAPSSTAKDGESLGSIDAGYAYNYAVMEDNYVQAEFEIKLPYSIPSDNKKHSVAVLNKELDTRYVYKAVPKLDLNAYLTARVTGWEDLNLIPGQANVYFDGTYVGQSYINTSTVSDTMELALGQDKSIQLKRTKLKDKIKEKMLDSDKLYTFAYDIIVKNGNAKSIEIIVLDQLPLSNNKQIVITKEDVDGADYNENSGTLTWRLNIKPKDTRKIGLIYTVKAPKEIPIAMY